MLSPTLTDTPGLTSSGTIKRFLVYLPLHEGSFAKGAKSFSIRNDGLVFGFPFDFVD